jgi:hypothetical protein
MKKTLALTYSLAALAACLLSGSALAARPLLKVSEEIEVAATPAAVWQVVGNFGDLGWHPAAASTAITTGDAQQAGAVRHIELKGGGAIDERLLGRNEAKRSLQYAIVASPLPVADYVSTLSVRPAAHGHSRVRWSSHFRRLDEQPAAGADDAGAKKVVRGIYSSGLQALQQQLNAAH